ncbi:acyltransferase [Sphingobacterium sp. SGG-5]|uniref:acyltransferase family protein n=1 Tax=Sphingobacterium sp. SGG-5 TaxID=2710881 RepID=UPI0013EC3F7B|nr:acyltransferase [Sphingobacterium sp. SGG-5]NGM63421.1 acyltransferase [Sphingobacterium sp. SGG-5]
MGTVGITTSKAVFLPGLNGIRAIAALAVVISHVNGRLENFGLNKLPYWDLANYGVTMFFTLSGFLITYLLFKELEKTGAVSIKKFYLRRVFRIWPLYYFYLLLILAIVGYAAIGQKLFMYLAILPNFINTFSTYGLIAGGGTTVAATLLGHYWSLGVEEQFYSFWPWVVKKVKNILVFLVIFPIFFLGLKVLAKYLQLEPIQFLLHYTRFGCLVIGALGAYLFWQKSYILKYLKHPVVQLLPWLLLLLIAFNKFHLFSIIDHEIVAVFVVVLIINQISDYKPVISLENRVFDYLGRISYGIYVYNPLVIFLFYSVVKLYGGLPNHIVSYSLVFIGVILFNISAAHISYFTLERYFLRFKSKYTTVKSKASKREFDGKH